MRYGAPSRDAQTYREKERLRGRGLCRGPGHTVDEAQLDACVDFGTASEEWWKNTLLGYEEMPGYPVQITGEMEMA